MVDISKTIYYLNREQEERHTREAARKLNLPYINLSNYPVGKDVLDLVPKDLAMRYQIVPYLKVGSVIKVGVVNPTDNETKGYLRKLSQDTKIKLTLVLISRSSLLHGLMAYDKKEKEEEKEAESKTKKEKPFEEEVLDIASTAKAVKKVTTTKLLDVIMAGAVKLHASDVHIEPEEEEFLLRYRIDGVLQDIIKLPIERYKTLLSRVKFLAKLRMDKKNEPQDGRFSVKTLGETIDLRVSTLPSAYGESIVLRLLGQEKDALKLAKLGFRSNALSTIKAAIARPHGMILTSGPTGSGKTSTLYAIVMELNKPETKIITLEDPVEYQIPGVEQSQINKNENYNFSSGLKAVLRQDPDIVMVGEIRDAETAETAIQAAITGHLMLSTIHANSAPGVFVRLLEIGVKPFLLTGSINIVMAQRLVRKICLKCREEFIPKPEVWQEIVKTLDPIKNSLSDEFKTKIEETNPRLMRGKGCADCGNNGYKGRQAIIEVLVPNDQIEKLIAKKVSLAEFQKAAKLSGMVTMEQDGLTKVLSGTTTYDEVWRVTKD